jgi:hypothetical protein
MIRMARGVEQGPTHSERPVHQAGTAGPPDSAPTSALAHQMTHIVDPSRLQSRGGPWDADIGTGGNALEREADQAADQVAAVGGGTPPDAMDVGSGGGDGRPLPQDIRDHVEPVLHADLGHVRVHTGPEADRVGALAFARGSGIWLGSGADVRDRRLMAHEATHVVQQDRLGGSAARTIMRRPKDPRGSATDWAHYEDAFRDPNLISHQQALEELATRRDPRAFDLIRSRIGDKWDASYAMDAALAFFIFYPDVLLGRLDDVTGPGGGSSITVLNGLLAHRPAARGPGADAAYQRLDVWMAARDASEAGGLTRALQRRQTRTTTERMRRTIADSYWISTEKLAGAATFVTAMDELATQLPALPDKDVQAVHGSVMSADPVVTRIEGRLDQLYRRIVAFVVDLHLPSDSDEIQFIRQELIKPYDEALAKGRDFAALREAAERADRAFRDQAALYQSLKIKRFRDAWQKIAPPNLPWPLTDAGGLRAGARTLWSKYDEHHANLAPRITDLLSRHDKGEVLSVAEMSEIQRDLLTLQLEQSALSDYIGMFLLHEQLVRVEPKGASSHVVMDFDDIEADARRYASIILGAVVSGNLQPYIRLSDDVDFRIIFKRAESRADTIRDQQLVLQLGVLAASFLIGFGVGALVRGGTMLAFGVEVVEAGTFGARALAATEFVGNVTAFTIGNEALNSATFGTKFDVGSLPGKLVENALMFAVFGGLGKLTAGIGKGASGPLMQVLSFGARQGVNLALFSGVGVLGQLVFHGQLPPDWKRFMIQSVASYAMLAVLGKAVEPLRLTVDGVTLDPLVQKRLAALAARQEALGRQLDTLTGATSTSGEGTLTREQAEVMRRRILELSADYRSLFNFLRTSGKLTAADAAQVTDALLHSEQTMTDAVLLAERVRIVALDRLADLRPAGDGVNYTYQARRTTGRSGRRVRSGLERALSAYDEAGYDVHTDAESGVITVRQPGLGAVIARFIPDIGAIPEGASAPATALRSAKDVVGFLRDHGFTESEIISFGGADGSRLGSRGAARVGRLAEKFTVADLKALAQALWKSGAELNDRMVDQLLQYVEAGRMDAFLRSREAVDDAAAEQGLDPDFEQRHGMSIDEANVRLSRPAIRQPDALWRLSEKHTAAPLLKQFGSGWVPSRRFRAPTAAAGESLGSTVPEYYNADLNTAVEVKRLGLAELGIEPAHPLSRTTPSEQSVEALQRARRQLAGRRWALPGKAEGMAPAQNWIVFDVRGQGVTDLTATGSSLKSLLLDFKIDYDRLFMLNDGVLIEVR